MSRLMKVFAIINFLHGTTVHHDSQGVGESRVCEISGDSLWVNLAQKTFSYHTYRASWDVRVYRTGVRVYGNGVQVYGNGVQVYREDRASDRKLHNHLVVLYI